MSKSLIVPMYHRVSKRQNPPSDYCLPKSVLEEHISYFKNNFDLVSPNAIYQAKNQSILLTFDDGWLSFYEHGFPLLQEYNVPALVLVNPGLIEGTCNLSLEEVHPQMEWGTDRYMNIQELKELASSNLITVGSHGMCHKNLREIQDNTELEYELYRSKKQLKEWLNTKVNHFSFPRCRYNSKSLSLANEFYDVVFTFHGETNTLPANDDKLEVLKRIELSESSLSDLKTQLSWPVEAYYSTYNFLKDLYFRIGL